VLDILIPGIRLRQRKYSLLEHSVTICSRTLVRWETILQGCYALSTGKQVLTFRRHCAISQWRWLLTIRQGIISLVTVNLMHHQYDKPTFRNTTSLCTTMWYSYFLHDYLINMSRTLMSSLQKVHRRALLHIYIDFIFGDAATQRGSWPPHSSGL
jgi:hypothetical protein